jgi:hypothetical protein
LGKKGSRGKGVVQWAADAGMVCIVGGFCVLLCAASLPEDVRTDDITRWMKVEGRVFLEWLGIDV